jgi:hypothetical protein
MEATGVYDQWLESLKLLRQITDPPTRKAFSEDLYTLQEDARKLLQTNVLTSTVKSRLEILLSRSPEQWMLTLPPARA